MGFDALSVNGVFLGLQELLRCKGSISIKVSFSEDVSDLISAAISLCCDGRPRIAHLP